MRKPVWLEKIINKLFSKKSGQRGDSLVETLVALTIAALSLTLLAMAISATSAMAKKSEDKLVNVYELENALAAAQPSEDCQGDMTITLSNGTELTLLEDGNGDVVYCVPESQSGTVPVISYTWEGGDDD